MTKIPYPLRAFTEKELTDILSNAEAEVKLRIEAARELYVRGSGDQIIKTELLSFKSGYKKDESLFKYFDLAHPKGDQIDEIHEEPSMEGFQERKDSKSYGAQQDFEKNNNHGYEAAKIFTIAYRVIVLVLLSINIYLLTDKEETSEGYEFSHSEAQNLIYQTEQASRYAKEAAEKAEEAILYSEKALEKASEASYYSENSFYSSFGEMCYRCP